MTGAHPQASAQIQSVMILKKWSRLTCISCHWCFYCLFMPRKVSTFLERVLNQNWTPFAWNGSWNKGSSLLGVESLYIGAWGGGGWIGVKPVCRELRRDGGEVEGWRGWRGWRWWRGGGGGGVGDGGGVAGGGSRLFTLKCDRRYLNACTDTYLTHMYAVSRDISYEIGMCQNRSLRRSCRQDKKANIWLKTTRPLRPAQHNSSLLK